MDKFIINGGKKLKGKIKISGAKNSALALMPATILSSGQSILSNIPEVNDIYTMTKLLKHLGSEVTFNDHKLLINNDTVNNQTAPYKHVKKMRASVYVLGPLLARYGYAKVSMPGGCAWGPRPINLHLEALKKLGVSIDLEDGYIIAKAKKLFGANIHFNISSVGATGNTMMAASLAKGTTVINNAATEPEIVLLAQFLQSMGARIDGIGTSTLTIEGVDILHPVEIENIGDRIEAGTILIAGAITGGKIEMVYNNSENIRSVLIKLEQSGLKILKNKELISIDATDFTPLPVDVSTGVFPGFPTDMQAQWTAFMTQADGESTISDTIYFDRFKHVPELNRLGAEISIFGNSAVVKGKKHLKGAKVMSTDLRASASLVLAGLAAEGETEVLRIYHLDRGYQRIEEKLSVLGADIKRVSTTEF